MLLCSTILVPLLALKITSLVLMFKVNTYLDLPIHFINFFAGRCTLHPTSLTKFKFLLTMHPLKIF